MLPQGVVVVNLDMDKTGAKAINYDCFSALCDRISLRRASLEMHPSVIGLVYVLNCFVVRSCGACHQFHLRRGATNDSPTKVNGERGVSVGDML